MGDYNAVSTVLYLLKNSACKLDPVGWAHVLAQDAVYDPTVVICDILKLGMELRMSSALNWDVTAPVR